MQGHQDCRSDVAWLLWCRRWPRRTTQVASRPPFAQQACFWRGQRVLVEFSAIRLGFAAVSLSWVGWLRTRLQFHFFLRVDHARADCVGERLLLVAYKVVTINSILAIWHIILLVFDVVVSGDYRTRVRFLQVLKKMNKELKVNQPPFSFYKHVSKQTIKKSKCFIFDFFKLLKSY